MQAVLPFPSTSRCARALTTNMWGTFLIKDCLAIEYGKGKRLGDKGEAETRL